MRKGKVFFDKIPAGIITEDDEGFIFKYDEKYLQMLQKALAGNVVSNSETLSVIENAIESENKNLSADKDIIESENVELPATKNAIEKEKFTGFAFQEIEDMDNRIEVVY